MSTPIIKSGQFHAGKDLECGENVVIDVAEEVIVGHRVTLPDNAYFSGRRITLGNDFFGYAWEWKRLDVGRGRKEEEHALLTVGDRCVFHDNKIDLSRSVVIGNDVGLSPEVTIYTHGYWQSVLEGYPCKYQCVQIDDGTIVGYRSILLPGTILEKNIVIGAGSVVTGTLEKNGVYAGSPAVWRRQNKPLKPKEQQALFQQLVLDYANSLRYRGVLVSLSAANFPIVVVNGAQFNLIEKTLLGEEDVYTDDFRWFLFTRGIRIYTERRFKKLLKG